MADGRELVEMAEALGEPPPDPALSRWQAAAAILDRLQEAGADVDVVLDLLALAGYGESWRLGEDAIGLAGTTAWKPSPRCTRVTDTPGELLEVLTGRWADAFRDDRAGTRLDVLAVRLGNESPPMRTLWGQGYRFARGEDQEQHPPARRFPTPQEVLARMQDPGPVEDLVPEGTVEEQHPTPQEMVERAVRPGALDPTRDRGIMRIGSPTRCEVEVDEPRAVGVDTHRWDLEGIEIREVEDGIEIEGRSVLLVHRILAREPNVPPRRGQPVVRWRVAGGAWQELGAAEVSWTSSMRGVGS